MINLPQATGLSDAEVEILETIRKVIRKIMPSDDIVLFGSRAQGEGREDSDWDVLILLADVLNGQVKHRLRKALYEEVYLDSHRSGGSKTSAPALVHSSLLAGFLRPWLL